MYFSDLIGNPEYLSCVVDFKKYPLMSPLKMCEENLLHENGLGHFDRYKWTIFVNKSMGNVLT